MNNLLTHMLSDGIRRYDFPMKAGRLETMNRHGIEFYGDDWDGGSLWQGSISQWWKVDTELDEEMRNDALAMAKSY